MIFVGESIGSIGSVGSVLLGNSEVQEHGWRSDGRRSSDLQLQSALWERGLAVLRALFKVPLTTTAMILVGSHFVEPSNYRNCNYR